MPATWLSVGEAKDSCSGPPGVEEAHELDEGAHLSLSGEAQWVCQRTWVSGRPHPYPIHVPPILLPLPSLEVGMGAKQIKKEGNVSHSTFLSLPPYPTPSGWAG